MVVVVVVGHDHGVMIHSFEDKKKRKKSREKKKNHLNELLIQKCWTKLN